MNLDIIYFIISVIILLWFLVYGIYYNHIMNILESKEMDQATRRFYEKKLHKITLIFLLISVVVILFVFR